MTEKLIALLKASGVHAWEVTDVVTDAWEFYFIRHKLDQNRAVSVRHVFVNVFETTDGCKTLGSASAEVPLGATEDEMKKLISDLSYRATLVKNAYYPLNPAVADEGENVKIDVPAIAKAYIGALRSLPETATEDINSYEIFVRAKSRRFINSNGVDVRETYPSSMAEVIVNARRDGHEIELYRSFTSGECDEAVLKEDLVAAMRQGRDRLAAEKTPALGKVAVVFSSDDACEIYDYFSTRLDPAMLFRHFSDYKIGEPISDALAGDKVTVRTVKTLPGSSENFSYDREGAPIRDETLMENGVPRFFTGGRMFSCLMGLENTFIPTNVVFGGGTKTEEEIRRGAYLEAVEFSDFQVDPVTGDVFGELRLGYYHDGQGHVTPVSGGSVSGDMGEFLKTMTMSKETKRNDNIVYPKLTRLEDVTFAG
ncbi:MAG: TldD/PmbA family protein [Clostridia bacterium]|nr:TldD/PmbA family protein [Clostridia bacterium]